jgi:chromosome partitioning protein
MERAPHSPRPSGPKRRTPWETVSARVLALVSRKGGVGKTTSAVNLGAAFALSGHSVLVIGADSQCGVARTLGCAPEELPAGLIDLFVADATLTELAQPSPLADLFFVSPRVNDLRDEERLLSALETAPDRLATEVDRARNLYDTILIDCPPHFGPATRAALRAADGVLVPLQAEELCRDSLGSLLASLDELRDAAGPTGDLAELEGIFLTMLNARTRMGRHVASRVAEEFGPMLLETAVPRTTRLSEMALRGKPSVIYDRRSAGSRAYFHLADELLHRHRERDGVPAGILDTAAASAPGAPPGDGSDGPVASGRAPHATGPRAASGPSDRGGLERLLGDLRASGSLSVPSVPSAADLAGEPSDPELVSLDDLLAEEESRQQGWDGGWREDDRDERLN